MDLPTRTAAEATWVERFFRDMVSNQHPDAPGET
jgi:hypothetical protein